MKHITEFIKLVGVECIVLELMVLAFGVITCLALLSIHPIQDTQTADTAANIINSIPESNTTHITIE